MATQVIIGGGPAATNAVETIRQLDSESKITLICDEPAHSRMALPYWLAGDIPREHTHTGDDAYFSRLNVETRFGVRVDKVDPANNSVTLNDGGQVAYDNLLIATGSSPLGLSIPGVDLPGVQPLWSLEHTAGVLATTNGLKKPRVVMIGAGFIGFIVLNAMFKRGWDLTVVEREGQVLPRMLDRGAASIVESWLGSQGVGVHTAATAKSITEQDGGKILHLDNGEQIEADVIIVATGIKPNLGLIDGAGIDTDLAILVNDRMQTNIPNIYAAGDIAQGPVMYSDQSGVHPIQPTAVDHGRIAGANMAGQEVHYKGSLLMNVVDVCGLQAASFGNWNDAGAEETTIDNPNDRVYRKMLWREDQIVGAIFLGKPNDMGMLTDVGMIKGILQTESRMGPWKSYLQENPFDVRRAYVAAGVAQKLAATTLLGRPSQTRGYQYGDVKASVPDNPSHAVYVGTKEG